MTEQIVMNEHYIAEKNGKKQIVKIDSETEDINGKRMYGYYYGNFNFHDGYCYPEQLRSLTTTERLLLEQNKFFDLPQEFYQTFIGSPEIGDNTTNIYDKKNIFHRNES